MPIVKLYDLKNDVQAVVSKCYDTDEEKYVIAVVLHAEKDDCFIKTTITMGRTERKQMEEVFNEKLTQDSVQAMADDQFRAMGF